MVKVKEGFFKRQETLSNENVLLAHGGHKPLSEFKIGDYLPIAGGTMTGNINFVAGATPSTANGIYFSNGSHIATSGNTLYVFGASGVNIYPSTSSTSGLEITDSSLKYKSNTVLDSGNSSVSGGGSAWGASLTVKINNNEKTLQLPQDPNHVEVPGSTNQLAHYKTTSTIGAVTGSIGASNRPIWINAGVPTASGATVGSATNGIYLAGGIITKMTYNLAATINSGTAGKLAYYSNATTIGAYSSNVGTTAKPVYIDSGVPTALTATVGSATVPIYLSNGEFKACTLNTNLGYIATTQVKASSTPGQNITGVGHITPNAHAGSNIGSAALHFANGYFNNLYVSGTTLYTGTEVAYTGTFISQGRIELTGSTPYLDFKANNAPIDYQTRLQAAIGKLTISRNSAVSATAEAPNQMSTTTYNSRDIYPLLEVRGSIFAKDSNIESNSSFIMNRSSSGGGYYIKNNDETYGRLYIGATGTAANESSSGNQGWVALQLGNSTAHGATGTTDGNNNARGIIQIYGPNNNYTNIYSQSNDNRAFYLPAYGGATSETGHMYAIHAGSNAAVGTSTRPIYVAANGRVTQGTYELKATINAGTANHLAYYSSATAISAYSSNVGTTAKPVYIASGVPTALTATVGNSIQPIYLNAGTPTAGSTYFFIAYTALYGGKGATNINFNIPDSTRLSGTYYLNTAINGATTAFQNAPQTYGLVVDFNQFAGHLQFSSTNTANEIKARSYWWTGNTGFTYPSWVTLIHTGNYSSYLGYIATTAVQASSTAGQNITGVGHITPNATNTYTSGSTSLLWSWTHTNRINLNRAGNAAFGRIYYYNSSYYTWVDYMSQSTAGYAPTGGQPSTTTEVTSWAKRSLIENSAGYGWIWEACTNAAAGTTSTKPTARMSLSSNTGRLRVESAASTTANNTGGLIISTALNASSGNIALELWRGTNASWMISNEAGDLHIRDNYTTVVQTTYLHDNVKIAYNTGTITAHSIQPASTNTYNLGSASLRWANGYFTNLYVSGSTSYTSVDSAVSGTFISQGRIELTGSTPYLDFKANNAGIDYQTRLTANIGKLTISRNSAVSATAEAPNQMSATTYNSRDIYPLLHVGGTYLGGDIESSGTITNNRDANNGGFYIRINNTSYGDFRVHTVGTAASATTASTYGISILELGNNIAEGATGSTTGAHNARGLLRLYGPKGYYQQIWPQNTSLTADRNIYLPNYNGTAYLIHGGSNDAIGSATQPVYIAANGRATPTSFGLNVNVLPGSTLAVAYYSKPDEINASSSVKILSGIGATAGATLYGISITGNGRGYANQLVSGATGVFSYGDGGPQIRFIDDTQSLALIATRYDGAGGNMSLHLVSDQPRVVFATQEIVAHNRLSVGVNVPNTTYGAYLNTSTAHNTGHIYLLGINTSSSTSNTTQIVFGPTTIASQHVALSSNSKALIINPNVSSTTGQVYLGVNGNNSYFSSSGNVGIGTTAPAYKLHVVGNGYISTYLGVAIAPRTDYKLATQSAYVFGATVSAIYSGRTIACNINTGVVWLNSVEATAHYMLNRGGTGGGYFCYINNTQYARLYVGATGTASSASAQGTQGWAMIELGNNIARGAIGTTDGTNNACGYVRLWATNQYYTQIRAQGNGSHTVYLPNHTTDMYLVHAGNNNAVGDAYTPVYVAENGRVTPSSVTLNRTSYIASNTASLSSYWCKAWDVTITNIGAGGERHMQLLVTSEFQGYRGIISLRIRQVGANDSGAYNFTVTLVEIVGNIPLDRFRLYYNNSTGLCQLWGNVNIRYGSFSFTCLKKTGRYGEVNEFGTFYNTVFTTAQTLPSDSYVEMTVSGHYMGSSYFVNGHLYLDGAVAADSTANTTQIVYRAAGTQQVALSSNTNALIINPTTSGTTGQIYLGVNGKNTYFSSSGNFGIGTTAPTYKLDVRANMANWAFHVYNYDASGHASFYIARSNSNAGIWGGISDTTASSYLMALKNGTTGDGAGGNPVFYVGGDGKVGIGTQSPSYKLHLVNGYIGNTATYTTAENGVVGMYLTNKDSDTGQTSIGRIYLYNGHNDNNNGNLIVQATGGVIIGGGEGVWAYRELVGNNIESTHIVADGNVVLEANLGANSNDASGRIGAGINTSGHFIPSKLSTWSNAQTQTLGTSSYHWGKLYVGPNDSYGTDTKPIYWNAGVPAACTYELKATVNAGTANRIAYYSSATAISAASTLVSNGTYIRRASVSSSWNNTDDNSMIFQDSVNGLGAVLSVKTTGNHSWSIAHYSNANYHTDLLFGFLHADDHTGATEPVNRWRDCISLIPVTDAGTSRRAFVTANYTRTSATNGTAAVGNSTTPVYVNAKGIVTAGQSYSSYGDGRYVLKTGDTMTGDLYVTRTTTAGTRVRTTNSNGAIEILASTNRGLYDATNSVWVVGTNGTNTWLSQGSVGIGNTSPGYKLDVSGTIRATNNVYITAKTKGYFLTDANSFNYPAAYDNGENLWIGSTATASTHHKGQTFISSGYGSTTGNVTIRISVPNDDNNNATNYYAYHSGYHPFLNSGTAGKLAYYSAALVISQYTTTVGTSAKPIYMNAGVPTALTATVGTSARPIYLSSGTMTACSASIGTSTKPIYMSGGVMTASAASVGTSARAIYMASGVITALTASVGTSVRPVYFASGVPTAGATVSTLKGSFYDMKVLWCGICSRSSYSSTTWSLTKKGGLCDASVSYSSYSVTISLTAVSSASGVSGTINLCSTTTMLGNWAGKNSDNYNKGLLVMNITSQTTSEVSFKGYSRQSDNTHWRNESALGASSGNDDHTKITSFYVTMFGYIS